MKNLKQYIIEKLIINKNYKRQYKYYPKTWDELRQIILDRYKELGPGTKDNPINFNDIDVSKITTFYNSNSGGIFQYSKFEYIDVSYWDVSKVEYMNEMFYACESLKELKISDWNVSNTKNMYAMFNKCENLKSIGDISNWNVSNVKNMNGMFTGCKNLENIGDISNWDISNVEHMKHMFTNSGITNIPSWYKE